MSYYILNISFNILRYQCHEYLTSIKIFKIKNENFRLSIDILNILFSFNVLYFYCLIYKHGTNSVKKTESCWKKKTESRIK